MKAIGINGSPGKGWNTRLLVREALKSAGLNQ
jgi:multimeric flavodoxin WrbA